MGKDDNKLGEEILISASDMILDVEADVESPAEENEAPTPASVAAEIKAVAEHPVEIPEDDEEPATETITTTPPEKKSKKGLVVLIIILVLLIAGAATAAVFLWPTKKDKPASTNSGSSNTSTEVPTEEIGAILSGAWESQAEGGSCYVFSDDGESVIPKRFYWLRNCDDFTDNYYSGSVATTKGDAALKSLNTTVENVAQLLQVSEGSIKTENVYLFTLTARKRVVSGVDTSSTIGGAIKLLFVLTGDSTALGYQYNSGDMYSFAKNDEIKFPD